MNAERLNKQKVFYFFLMASLIYVYPIIRADYAYVDDSWRALLMAEDAWRTSGRILLEVMYLVLTFTGSIPNIFPLPLLVSVAVIAWAMTCLTVRYFSSPVYLDCLVVLPILCNPFFLGNLTYQYDGPGMVLGVAAVIFAITCQVRNVVLQVLLSGLLIAVAMSFYQLVITVFIGLCCIEIVWAAKNKAPSFQILNAVFSRVLQLVVGGVIYFLSAYQLNTSPRGNLSPFDSHWFEVVFGKLSFTMSKVGLLMSPGIVGFAIFILIAAAVGFLIVMGHILKQEGGWRILVMVLYVCTVPVIIFCIPGVMLVLKEPNLEARDFIGFSTALIFLFILCREFLVRVWAGFKWFVVIPVLFMFSLCFSYGQVLIAKKELEWAMASYISYDLTSRRELEDIKDFYLVGPETGGNWIPRAHGAMSLMPVLRYILSGSSVLLHVEFLPRLGINNVVGGDRREFFYAVSAADVKPEVVVDGKFYSIFLTGGRGYIVMKEITDPEDYMDRLSKEP